jgi:hypothetical protein
VSAIFMPRRQVVRIFHMLSGCSKASYQRGLNTKRPTIAFFVGPTKPLPSYDRQSRTHDTVKSREMTGRTQTLPWWLEGEGVKTTENKIHWASCIMQATFSKKVFMKLNFWGQTG